MSIKVAPLLGSGSIGHDYQIGLSRQREAVISSHFMDLIARNCDLQPYGPQRMAERARFVSPEQLDNHLLPALCNAARKFSVDRAVAAVDRARSNWKDYGLRGSSQVSEAEAITEVMFDRQFSRKAHSTRSRRSVRDEVARSLETNRRVNLVIPALPFKIMCPLKARGLQPDLAEVDLILSLYEIAHAIEVASELVATDATKIDSRFVVVSDGRRFDKIVNVDDEVIENYQSAVEGWIRRLGVDDYVSLIDYWALLRDRLPAATLQRKQEIARAAKDLYRDKLHPAFDIRDPQKSLALCRTLEPDPEGENPDGRFASLFKSLVYTMNYRSLDGAALSTDDRLKLYRELTSTMMDPRTDGYRTVRQDVDREDLRQSMLQEAWNATIDYLAEIKSDRDLENDPVLACMPLALRWTIHAKSGQFTIATPSVNGAFVQAWAGSAFFRLTKTNAIRLCSYPVVAIEGEDAIPVFEAGKASSGQPLFYVQRELGFEDARSFAANLSKRMTRRRLR